MMETFRQMVNDCLRVGLANGVSTLKRLSNRAILCYPVLARYNIVSYYKLHAIAKAAGILANRKQSIRRGYPTKTPYMKRPALVSCYGFKIMDGVLKVPLGDRQHFDISLNPYAKGILSDPAITVRSFTLAANGTVSICYCKQVPEIGRTMTTWVDRNLANVTYGNHEKVSLSRELSR